ncbi:hypothetical protein MATL_G00204610 [Megalops atlanticus]|uniref:C-type lectin domain-containing protein n=1 Tax=Megalops atlanticus TaxID=7932 RepID=A0A9D3T4D5_MEGAT|nr:hypothetical protein MATL_G00204610 [Megalops atlanticus]
MGKAAVLVAVVCLSALSLCDSSNESLDDQVGAGSPDGGTTIQDEDIQPLSSPEPVKPQDSEGGEGGLEEPEPTSPISDFENTYNYVLSRLAAMDQAIHRLNVAHYTLDVKMAQLLDRVSRLDGKIGETEDAVHQVSLMTKENRKEVGRLEGCQKGRRVGYKCFLVYRSYETYARAAQLCQERGGRMAMPRDRKEQEALADYARSFFHPGNWPVWLGINDQRSEGLYLFEDGTRVTYFQWRKHFLSSQPDGGKRENCVAMSSDDGDWWDNYCDRRMYYLCEFDA